MAASIAFQSSYKCGWMPSNRGKYERFKNTLLHGEDWSLGLKYFAMYWIDFRPQYDDDDDDDDSDDDDDTKESEDDDNDADDEDDSDAGDVDDDDKNETRLYSPMFENDRRLHAEGRLLKHLRLQWSVMQRTRVLSLTILQNASPCNKCSIKYQTLLGKIQTEAPAGINITIIFSSFHKVWRPSCIKGGHSHLSGIKKVHSKVNVAELKKLRAAGVTLRTTGYEDWLTLLKALQLPNTYASDTYNLSARKREDDSLSSDLQDLLK